MFVVLVWSALRRGLSYVETELGTDSYLLLKLRNKEYGSFTEQEYAEIVGRKGFEAGELEAQGASRV